MIRDRDRSAWPDIEVVKGYIRRVLTAVPEGGAASPMPYWAEPVRTQIVASLEFRGSSGLLELANGYAHLVDAAGCEWWARYLGEDRSRWIVRPDP